MPNTMDHREDALKEQNGNDEHDTVSSNEQSVAEYLEETSITIVGP